MNTINYKSTLYCIVILILSISTGTQYSFAQGNLSSSKVSGHVVKTNAQPIDYASVTLIKSTDSSLVKGTLTDADGKYIFDHLPAGNYLVKVNNIGYAKCYSNTVTLTENTTIELPPLQLVASTQQLQEVTVVSAKPLIEHQTDRTVINVENSTLAAGNSALEILQKAPGVTLDKDDNISLNGKQGVTVMINDKLTYLSATQLAALLRSTDGNTIQSVEIIPNPSAKYDAAGSSGIINIKLKKNKQSGTNGSLNTTIAQSTYFRDNFSLNLNHKTGKLNLFTNLSHNDGKNKHKLDLKRTVDSAGKSNTYFNQDYKMVNVRHNSQFRIGADYDLSSKNTIGVVASGYYNTETGNNNGITYLGTQPDVYTSYQHLVSREAQTYKNIAFNINDRYQIDTAGQSLSVDMDYLYYKNNGNMQYNTYFYVPSKPSAYDSLFIRNLIPSSIRIYTLKADYVYPFSKTLKLETGIKLSDVKTDNDLQAQTKSGLPGAIYENDATRTNRFIYDEKISAGYANLSKNYKNTSVQAGLRAEYTHSEGELLGGGSDIKRHYLNFFPSVFVKQTLSSKNEIGISYSRRIDRPSYESLNPFVYYVDQYTYQQGNPFLTPQYTNAYNLDYTYNHTINVSIGYSHTHDVITEAILTNVEKKTTYATNLNLSTQNYYNISFSSPFKLNKWWNGNFNAVGFYLVTKSDTLLGNQLNRGKAAYNLNLTQTFTPVKGYKLEVLGSYESSLVYGLYDVKARYFVDAGISHSFADKKANIKFAVSDIFNTLLSGVSSNYQTNHFTLRQKNDTRVARITFTYNFGNSKFKTQQHNTGSDDEKNRVKGGN
ncbi:TonB-dependent receptor [Mucilaginibacter robiniae]|uniref:TonB-dependent receptor n=1 Tax=Mucilaginibacter robiniae TaxID=2728022 RepID=A0A7L5DZN5_9SPHI|nr:outer membrane beta-barrel family protein [Mucilaginibacter robiniae]QJD96580.1 TonB-dependent receptor [Mucilaginibacter robiniae]